MAGLNGELAERVANESPRSSLNMGEPDAGAQPSDPFVIGLLPPPK